MPFLNEDPWECLAVIRARVPKILLQALIRGSSGVGYANYADKVVQFFVKQAASAGIDLFRIFDCFSWVENMRVSVDAVREAGKPVIWDEVSKTYRAVNDMFGDIVKVTPSIQGRR